MSLRVVLADDNSAFLQAATDSLRQGGCEVVGAVLEGSSAVAMAMSMLPDVVVLDVQMPGGGAELVARIAAECPDSRIMCLSARDDVATAAEMLAAGATAYVVKGALSEDLATTVRRTASGSVTVVGEAVAKLADELAAGRPGKPSELPGTATGV